MKNEEWGAGPWDNEPDSERFVYKGLTCHIKRHGELGTLCGYVKIPETHVLYGKEANTEIVVTHELKNWMEKHGSRKLPEEAVGFSHMLNMLTGKLTLDSLFVVHGGITLSSSAPFLNENGFFWGFDCGHFNDLSPFSYKRFNMDSGVYRTWGYVKSQVESLADQILSFDFTPTLAPEDPEDSCEKTGKCGADSKEDKPEEVKNNPPSAGKIEKVKKEFIKDLVDLANNMLEQMQVEEPLINTDTEFETLEDAPEDVENCEGGSKCLEKETPPNKILHKPTPTKENKFSEQAMVYIEASSMTH